MRPAPSSLEEPYRGRAVPPGSARYWSWLFAAPETRAPLLGMYALMAEWRALMDPDSEAAAARLKLAWWQEEILRLTRGVPVHPISRYLAAQPRAGAVDFALLNSSVEAAARHVAGAPLEHGAELEEHSRSLWADPLIVAAMLAREQTVDETVHRCTSALAAAEYFTNTIGGYRREARRGRIVFPIDELLAARIENEDLTAAEAPLHLQSYLDELRGRALQSFRTASGLLRPPERTPFRHLLVLASLGAAHLQSRKSVADNFRRNELSLRDLYLSWSTARRAARQA